MFVVAALVLTALAAVASANRARAAGTLLSQGKSTTASSTENAGYLAAVNATDGSTTTRWASAMTDAQWLQVDLGSVQQIDHVDLNWEAAYAKTFSIQSSADGTTFTNISPVTNGVAGAQTVATSGTGRYIRVNGITRATGYGYSLWEFQVYGGPVVVPNPTTSCIGGNVALNKPATASSTENGGTPAAAAFDGNTGTRWSSAFSDPQSLTVDFGTALKLCKVVLNWEAAYAKTFKVQVSNDGTTFTDASPVINGTAGAQTVLLAATGRYLRVAGLTRATGYGYSLWEVAAYTGNNDTVTPPVTTPPVTTPPVTTPPVTTPPVTTPPVTTPPVTTPPVTTPPVTTPPVTTPPATTGDVLLSYLKPGTASSSQDDAQCGGCLPGKAFDYEPGTRWASAAGSGWTDPGWIYVDLGATAQIHKVVLAWDPAFASAFEIQVASDPNGPWTKIYGVTANTARAQTLTGLNGTGRYVRMYGTARATTYGYSIASFDVYGTGGNPVAPPAPPKDPTFPATKLVFADEFNAAAGGTPDASKWTPEKGYGQNGEQQYYTDNKNAFTDGNGNMVLEARRETAPGTNSQFTSARFNTANKFTFTYGHAEARIKVSGSQGLWPAFWLLGANFPQVGWPACGEIDIMEHVGKVPNAVYSTIHAPAYNGGGGIGSPYTINGDFQDAFHTYAVDWDSKHMTFYVDGHSFFTIDKAQTEATRGPWVYDHPFFIILNNAVGGQWPGNADATTVLPNRMLVDYVRVYQ